MFPICSSMSDHQKRRELMPSMRLDAVAVTSGNLTRTAKFYSLLGFEFPEIKADTQHLEPITPAGEVRLMIDDKALMKSIIGKEPTPSNHSSFAIKCGSPAEVDVAVTRIRQAGFSVVKEP